MTPREAENFFREAKVKAEGHKQVAIAAAMKLGYPEQVTAIRAAERDYNLALANACDATGIMDGSRYRNAAAETRAPA